MQIFLPADVPLQTEKKVPLTWNGARFVANPPMTYPALHVLEVDIPGNSFNGYESIKMPVVLTEEGSFTDWDWKAFVDLEPGPTRYSQQTQVESASLEKSIQGIKQGKLKWDMKCAAMPRFESLIGRLFESYADRWAVLTTQEKQQDAIPAMGTPAHILFKKATPKALNAFRDRERTLADLAAINGLWAMADWLMDQGIPLTAKAVDSGLIHQALILSTKEATSRPSPELFGVTADKTNTANPQELAQWLDRWLKRLERFPLPTGELTWERERRLSRNPSQAKEIPNLTDSVVSFWAEQQVSWTGPNPSMVSGMKPLQRALFDRWVGHWNKHKVHLDSVMMPTRYDAYGEKPPYRPLTQVWQGKTAPWMSLVEQLQSPLKRSEAMEQTLPAPASTRNRGPRF